MIIFNDKIYIITTCLISICVLETGVLYKLNDNPLETGDCCDPVRTITL